MLKQIKSIENKKIRSFLLVQYYANFFSLIGAMFIFFYGYFFCVKEGWKESGLVGSMKKVFSWGMPFCFVLIISILFMILCDNIFWTKFLGFIVFILSFFFGNYLFIKRQLQKEFKHPTVDEREQYYS